MSADSSCLSRCGRSSTAVRWADRMAVWQASTCCHVCGWDTGDFPWGESGTDPSWVICDCCGCEFGYEDASADAASQHQRRWIDAGARWFHPRAQPVSWELNRQLATKPAPPPGVRR